jgi:hypothetical protein
MADLGELKRNVGRRTADHLRQKSTWVLVAGVLLQGGFLTMSWRLLAIGERQLDRERALLVEQHAELLQAVERLGSRVDALEGRAEQLGEAASTVQGMVLGRLKCPNLACAPCRKCPEYQAPIIITTPAATVAPQPRPPEVEKPEQRRDSRGRVVK